MLNTIEENKIILEAQKWAGKSKLRTAIYPEGIKVKTVNGALNDRGNLEISFHSQKIGSRANVLELTREDARHLLDLLKRQVPKLAAAGGLTK